MAHAIEEKLNTDVRKKILSFEEMLSKHPNAMNGDCFPLKHEFADGMYIRTIYTPKGALIVTKIFKQTHATFLLRGECSIATEDGVKRVKAPFRMVTKAGTKRVIYCHEDVEWTTVHENKENTQDLAKLENVVIAKSYEELEFNEDEQEIVTMAGGGK